MLSNKAYDCKNNHSFDISKDNYLNLILQNKGKKNPSGDNKEMINARNYFLNKGYYDILKKNLCNISAKYAEDFPVIIDAGCGEGYYIAHITDFLLCNGKSPQVFGIDISKSAIKKAAKRTKDVTFMVVNAFDIPIFINSIDIVFSIFAPIAKEEFKRILKLDGYLIIVSPGKEHLFELKTFLYDKAYLNEQNEEKIEGFEMLKTITESNNIEINNKEDINNLFLMTPYYWKTSIESSNKLKELESLKTKIQFNISIYKKTSNKRIF